MGCWTRRWALLVVVVVVECRFGVLVRGRGLMRRRFGLVGLEDRGLGRLPFLGLRRDLGMLCWREGNLGRWRRRYFGSSEVWWMGQPLWQRESEVCASLRVLDERLAVSDE